LFIGVNAVVIVIIIITIVNLTYAAILGFFVCRQAASCLTLSKWLGLNGIPTLISLIKG
jgi:hypothetical protein